MNTKIKIKLLEMKEKTIKILSIMRKDINDTYTEHKKMIKILFTILLFIIILISSFIIFKIIERKIEETNIKNLYLKIQNDIQSTTIKKDIEIQNKERYYQLYLDSIKKIETIEKIEKCNQYNKNYFLYAEGKFPYKKIITEMKDCSIYEKIEENNKKTNILLLNEQKIKKQSKDKSIPFLTSKKETVIEAKEVEIKENKVENKKVEIKEIKTKKENKIEDKIEKKVVAKILKDLYLNDCRVVQNDREHLNRGHVYATDIACIRGKTFQVKAPLTKNIYVVSKIGTDERLGTYIILKHGDMRYVFGHTKGNLKEGDRILPGDTLGYTNLTGLTQNYHLHFEVWKNNGLTNITFDGKESNDKYSEKLLLQREWIKKIEKKKEKKVENKIEVKKGEKETKKNNKSLLEKIADFIISQEGFSPKSYCDNLVKRKDGSYIKYCPTKKERYSIGYGTISYYGEKEITKEEGYKRKMYEIKKILPIVNRSCYTDNQKISIASYIYNTGGNQMGYKRYVSQCRKKDVVYIMNIYGHSQNLNKRRAIEMNLFYKKG